MKILFITNRNITTTSGELRLIKNRAESLYNDYEIVTDFIAISSKKRINGRNREEIKAGGEIKYVGYSGNKLLMAFDILNKYCSIKAIIREKIRSNQYNIVVLSGIGMAHLAKYIKDTMNIRIVVDVHGSSEDMLEVARTKSLSGKIFFELLYKLDVYTLMESKKYIDGYLVVTDSLGNYLAQYDDNHLKRYIVPCATDDVDFNIFEKYDEYRSYYRKKYGIKDNETVLIYSGGASTWQCIDETVLLYRKLKELDSSIRLVVFSRDEEKIKRAISNDSDVILDSIDPVELKKVLFMGDIAIMLRKNNITNNVAFPNKYLEYVNSRMKIISTPYLYGIASQIKKYNLGYLYEFNKDYQSILNYIKNSQVNSIDIVEKVIMENSFKKCLSDFVKDVKDAKSR